MYVELEVQMCENYLGYEVLKGDPSDDLRG